MASSGKSNTKKEKGHYVPSRYKQAAEKISIQSSNSRENTTFMKASLDSTRSQPSSNSSQDTSSYSKLGTPQEGKKMTSTPATKSKCMSLALNASAVTDWKGHLTLPPFKEEMGLQSDVKKHLAQKKNLPNVTHLGPVVASHRDKKKNEYFDKKVEDARLDILYTEYLQVAFLEFQAEEALKKRSAVALEKIHKLFGLVMLHVEKFKALQKGVLMQSSMIKMHEHCQKQESIFSPVLEILPSLEEQYKSIAEAVNACKHKLNVKNVMLLEPGCEGEVIELLDKTNDVICDFLQKFKNIKEICSSAEIMQNYTDVGEQILDALKKGSDLLAEAKDLVLSESVLELGCEKS